MYLNQYDVAKIKYEAIEFNSNWGWSDKSSSLLSNYQSENMVENLCWPGIQMISALKIWWKKTKKFQNQNFVHCLVSMCFQYCNSYIKKIPMFKIEYLSSYIFFFQSGGYCVCIEIEIPLRLSPAPTFRALKKYEHSDVTFSYSPLWIQNDLINWPFKYKVVTSMRWYRNRTIWWTALVFNLCVFLPCDLTSWILTTVTRDGYQPHVTVIVFDGCFHASVESERLWFDSRKLSFVLLLQHQ